MEEPGDIVGEVLETSTSEIWLERDGIVRVSTPENMEIDVEGARANVVAVARLGRGKRVPLLVLHRRGSTVTRDARKYFVSPGNATISAMAMLAKSRVAAMSANLFLGVFAAEVPTRLFLTEPKALEWLMGFR